MNKKNILFILIILIFLFPNIGISAKFDYEADKKQQKEKNVLEEEINRIGNTYEIKFKPPPPFTYDRTVGINFYVDQSCNYDKKITINEETDFIIQDIIDFKLAENNKRVPLFFKLYKIILDPGGEKLTSYTKVSDFSFELRKFHTAISIKSEMNDEERRKLIADNEKEKIAEEQEKKRIAKVLEKERQQREDKLHKQRISEIRKKHPEWSDKTMRSYFKRKRSCWDDKRPSNCFMGRAFNS